MSDHIHIRLYRTATQWKWSVDNDGGCDDFVHGAASDYTIACAEALAVYDRMITADRDAP